MSARRPVRRWGPFAGASAALLAWSTVGVPRLPPVPAVRAAANVAATAVLVGAADRIGVPWAQVWGGRAAAGRGARAGAAALAVVATGYAILLAHPSGRRLLGTAGAERLPAGAVAVRAAVLIPVGTVLCEEVAFRGVLPALAPRSPVLATSAVFGLWHVGPARHPLGPPAPVPAPVGSVVGGTALAGVVLGALRRRTGSLLAPAGLHLATNSLGLVAAALAGRVRSRPRPAPAADRRRPPARPRARRRRRP